MDKNEIWIRRDRQDGEETELTAEKVLDKIWHAYHYPKQALVSATKEAPLTTGFADYWPKPKEKKSHAKD